MDFNTIKENYKAYKIIDGKLQENTNEYEKEHNLSLIKNAIDFDYKTLQEKYINEYNTIDKMAISDEERKALFTHLDFEYKKTRLIKAYIDNNDLKLIYGIYFEFFLLPNEDIKQYIKNAFDNIPFIEYLFFSVLIAIHSSFIDKLQNNRKYKEIEQETRIKYQAIDSTDYNIFIETLNCYISDTLKLYETIKTQLKQKQITISNNKEELQIYSQRIDPTREEKNKTIKTPYNKNDITKFNETAKNTIYTMIENEKVKSENVLYNPSIEDFLEDKAFIFLMAQPKIRALKEYALMKERNKINEENKDNDKEKILYKIINGIFGINQNDLTKLIDTIPKQLEIFEKAIGIKYHTAINSNMLKEFNEYLGGNIFDTNETRLNKEIKNNLFIHNGGISYYFKESKRKERYYKMIAEFSSATDNNNTTYYLIQFHNDYLTKILYAYINNNYNHQLIREKYKLYTNNDKGKLIGNNKTLIDNISLFKTKFLKSEYAKQRKYKRTLTFDFIDIYNQCKIYNIITEKEASIPKKLNKIYTMLNTLKNDNSISDFKGIIRYLENEQEKEENIFILNKYNRVMHLKRKLNKYLLQKENCKIIITFGDGMEKLLNYKDDNFAITQKET